MNPRRPVTAAASVALAVTESSPPETVPWQSAEAAPELPGHVPVSTGIRALQTPTGTAVIVEPDRV